jgi:hypothetical protein
MNDLMVASGLRYEESRAWYAKEERGRYTPGLSDEAHRAEYESEAGFFNGVKKVLANIRDGVVETAEGIGQALRSVPSIVEGAFKKLISIFPEPEQNPETEINSSPYMSVPGGDSLNFYNQIMNPVIAKQYSYETNKQYMCNAYVRDMIQERYGQEVYDMIFQGKSENTNAMFDSFLNNPNLTRLDPESYSISAIQKMADAGTMVLMIYKNLTPGESGHIAFVGNSRLKLFTEKPIPSLEGKTGRDVISLDQLILVQAGTYTGNTIINYGTNDWGKEKKREGLLRNNLYFYALKKR